VLYQGRKSLSTFVEKRAAYLLDQPACYTPSPAFWGHRQAIDVTPPSVPSTNYRTYYPRGVYATSSTAPGSWIKRVNPSIESVTLGGVTSASCQSRSMVASSLSRTGLTAMSLDIWVSPRVT
jgi:hypothetical protein